MKKSPRTTPIAQALPPDVRVARRAAHALLLVLAVLAVAALGVAGATRAAFLDFRVVTLDGDLKHHSVPAIRAQVLPGLSGNYFTLDLAEARRRFETLPWVRRATVRRVWPDRLVVTLQEHRAAAYWERDGADPRLVDGHGELFEADLGDVEDDGLPLLRGPEGSAPEVWDMYRRLTPVFEPLDERIAELGLSARGSWQAELRSGARIELGRGSAAEVVARTQRFVATVGQVTSRYRRSIEHADLRHQDAYALRLRGVGTVREAVARR